MAVLCPDCNAMRLIVWRTMAPEPAAVRRWRAAQPSREASVILSGKEIRARDAARKKALKKKRKFNEVFTGGDPA